MEDKGVQCSIQPTVDEQWLNKANDFNRWRQRSDRDHSVLKRAISMPNLINIDEIKSQNITEIKAQCLASNLSQLSSKSDNCVNRRIINGKSSDTVESELRNVPPVNTNNEPTEIKISTTQNTDREKYISEIESQLVALKAQLSQLLEDQNKKCSNLQFVELKLNQARTVLKQEIVAEKRRMGRMGNGACNTDSLSSDSNVYSPYISSGSKKPLDSKSTWTMPDNVSLSTAGLSFETPKTTAAYRFSFGNTIPSSKTNLDNFTSDTTIVTGPPAFASFTAGTKSRRSGFGRYGTNTAFCSDGNGVTVSSGSLSAVGFGRSQTSVAPVFGFSIPKSSASVSSGENRAQTTLSSFRFGPITSADVSESDICGTSTQPSVFGFSNFGTSTTSTYGLFGSSTTSTLPECGSFGTGTKFTIPESGQRGASTPSNMPWSSLFGTSTASHVSCAGLFGVNTKSTMSGFDLFKTSPSTVSGIFGSDTATTLSGPGNFFFNTPFTTSGTGHFSNRTASTVSSCGAFGSSAFGFQTSAMSNAFGSGCFGTNKSNAFGFGGVETTPNTITSSVALSFTGTKPFAFGTIVKFLPPTGTDTMLRGGQSTNIKTKHQCIGAMKEYENRSLEELRYEDYVCGRKAKKAEVQEVPYQATTSRNPTFGANTSWTNNVFGGNAVRTQYYTTTSRNPTFGATISQTNNAFGGNAFGAQYFTTESKNPTFGANTNQNNNEFGGNAFGTRYFDSQNWTSVNSSGPSSNAACSIFSSRSESPGIIGRNTGTKPVKKAVRGIGKCRK